LVESNCAAINCTNSVHVAFTCSAAANTKPNDAAVQLARFD
uniref:Uncharacterized protein n=1 Tax=Aegilops tauschii subsp. strangulata TaxID=200361 RepID=A0A452ZMV4_AEGTS